MDAISVQDDRDTIEAIEAMVQRIERKAETIIDGYKRDDIQDRVTELLTTIKGI